MIEFWYEFASTYSYPAVMRIEDLAEKSGVKVTWRPFLLGPIFKAQRWDDTPFNIYPAKGRYMWRDLERICKAQQIPFKRPTQFPRNGLRAARVACLAMGTEWESKFIRNVYQANFALDQDISSDDVLAQCLDGLVEDPQSVIVAAQSDEIKLRLRQYTEQAMNQGIFGAPTFMVDKEMFWGNDRLEIALSWK